MRNNIGTKKIDIDKTNYTPIATIKQEDNVIMKLELYKDGEAFDITRQTVTLAAKRSDKVIIEQIDGFTIDTNRLTIELKNNINAKIGLVYLELNIKDSTGSMTTLDFYLKVAGKIMGEDSLYASNNIASLEKIQQDFINSSNALLETVTENENTRVDAEGTRKLNEEIRGRNETSRSNAETKRVEAENLRKTAETDRVEAEKLRAAADALRDKKIEDIGSQCTKIANDFDEAVANVTNGNESATNSEIVQARNGEVNLNRRLDKFDSQLSESVSNTNIELNKKADRENVYNRSEIDEKVWGMSNMGQDVKEAMTGGSVAVVGENAVDTINLRKGSVTNEKMSYINTSHEIIQYSDSFDIDIISPDGEGYGKGIEITISPSLWIFFITGKLIALKGTNTTCNIPSGVLQTDNKYKFILNHNDILLYNLDTNTINIKNSGSDYDLKANEFLLANCNSGRCNAGIFKNVYNDIKITRTSKKIENEILLNSNEIKKNKTYCYNSADSYRFIKDGNNMLIYFSAINIRNGFSTNFGWDVIKTTFPSDIVVKDELEYLKIPRDQALCLETTTLNLVFKAYNSIKENDLPLLITVDGVIRGGYLEKYFYKTLIDINSKRNSMIYSPDFDYKFLKENTDCLINFKNLNLRIGITGTINFNDIKTKYPSKIVTRNNIEYLKLVDGENLAWDTYANTFRIYGWGKSPFYCISLLYNSFGYIKLGIMREELLDKRITTLEDKVVDLSTSTVPLYWNSHIESKSKNIINLKKKLGKDGFTFGFITDIHYGNSSRRGPFVLNKVMELSSINNAIMCGDVINNGSTYTKIMVEELYSQFVEDYRILGNRIGFLLGNHDNNSITQKFSETLNAKELYYYFMHNQDNNFKQSDDGSYYYFEDANCKVRYVCLNSQDVPLINTEDDNMKFCSQWVYAFRQKQIDWLINKALKVEEGWSIVLFSHVPPVTGTIPGTDNAINNQDIVLNIIKAYIDKTTYDGVSTNNIEEFRVNVNADFTNYKGNFIAWFAGHTHYSSDVKIDNKVLIITTENDSLYTRPPGAPKTLGTTTESAMDIVTIDKVNRKIYMTRIGAGQDRELTY